MKTAVETGQYMSAEDARGTIALLVPHLAKKRRWSDADCDSADIVFALWHPGVNFLMRYGADRAWIVAYLKRVRAVFLAVRAWRPESAAREFMTDPNGQIGGRRPLDLLRVSTDLSTGKDSVQQVLNLYAKWETDHGHFTVVKKGALVRV